jgi:hypothetical protein
VAVELKIDFCGTTAIRSPIEREVFIARRPNARRSSVERSSRPRRVPRGVAQRLASRIGGIVRPRTIAGRPDKNLSR